MSPTPHRVDSERLTSRTVPRRKSSVKLIPLLMMAGLVMTGCCSTNYDLQRSPTSDLQLRRYDLKHCLSRNGTSWDKEVLQSTASNNVQADLEEKEAIEREITRRDVTNYHWPLWVTYPYGHNRCNCQDWVVNL